MNLGPNLTGVLPSAHPQRDEGEGSVGNAGPRGGETWRTEFSLSEMALSSAKPNM